MFFALICLSFLPWSILDFKEKSGKVILAELNSFPSHVVNKHTGLKDASFSKCTCGHAGRHSSSFEFFASIHLLVFGCLFLVGQRLGGWVFSRRLANISAWSSSSSEVPWEEGLTYEKGQECFSSNLLIGLA